jgi:hypothetical protein
VNHDVLTTATHILLIRYISAMESWGCFFWLSSAAFWGYLFARVALMDGIRQKRRGPSGTILCALLMALSGMWLIALLFYNWELPRTAMILTDKGGRRADRKYISQQLQ